MNETELVQIYHGSRKGKTTTAIGAAMRAAGRGYQVLVARLLKTDDSGEVNGLVRIPGVTVLPYDQNFGFFWSMTQSQRKAAALYYDHCLLIVWSMALEAGGEEPYGMLVLDEAIGAYNLGFMDESRLIKALKERPVSLEAILTGRCSSEVLQEQANHITEAVMRRRPYERGIGTREGVEY